MFHNLFLLAGRTHAHQFETLDLTIDGRIAHDDGKSDQLQKSNETLRDYVICRLNISVSVN